MSASNSQAQPQKPLEGNAQALTPTPFVDYCNAAAYHSQAAASYINSASYHQHLAACYSNDALHYSNDALHYSNLSVSYGYLAASFGNNTTQPAAHHNVLATSLLKQQGGFPTQCSVSVGNPFSNSSRQIPPSHKATRQPMVPQPFVGDNSDEDNRMNGLGDAEWTTTELGEQLEEFEERERELERHRKKQQEIEKRILAEKKTHLHKGRQELKKLDEKVKSKIVAQNMEETNLFKTIFDSKSSQETPLLISTNEDEEEEEGLSHDIDLLDTNCVSESIEPSEHSSQDSFAQIWDDLDVRVLSPKECDDNEVNEVQELLRQVTELEQRIEKFFKYR